MTSNTVCVTGEIDNVDFTREDGTSVTITPKDFYNESQEPEE